MPKRRAVCNCDDKRSVTHQERHDRIVMEMAKAYEKNPYMSTIFGNPKSKIIGTLYEKLPVPDWLKP